MAQKKRTIKGENGTFGGDGGSKIVKNRRTSLIDVVYAIHKLLFPL